MKTKEKYYWGVVSDVAKNLNVSVNLVSNVLRGNLKDKRGILKEADRLNKINAFKKHVGKSPRTDIINNLIHGDIVAIAEKLNCEASLVSRVLNNKRSDNLGIIKEAEKLAAINIWQSRFCKHKSLINKSNI